MEYLAGVSPNAGPWSFSGDGRWLGFWPLQPESDLWVAAVERAPGLLRLRRPQPLLHQARSNGAPAISPDGRWLAHVSAENGGFEVYVTTFLPNGRGDSHKWQISSGGGWSPIWSRNGGRLFYQTPDERIEVVDFTWGGNSLLPGKPRDWSAKRLGSTGLFQGFDTAPDESRLLTLLSAEEPRINNTLMRVMLNVDDELQRRTHHRDPGQ